MTVVIGMGNEFRGDDAIGLRVAELLRERNLPDTRIVTGIADAGALIEAWDRAESVFVIDCAVSGASAGTIHRYDGLDGTLPEDLFSRYSTHGLSLTRTIELARILGRLPKRMTVVGIEGSQFKAGAQLGEALEDAAAEVTDEVCRKSSKGRI